MPYDKDPRVDAYLGGLPDWQRDICGNVRDLVHEADPEVEETIKRTVQPYFVLDGNICALLAAKDHVNVFLYDGAIVPDPEGIITAGPREQDGENGRLPEGRGHQRASATRDVQADHRQQSRRRLAQAQRQLDGRTKGDAMADLDLFHTINALSAEEEGLYASASDGSGLTQEQRDRLDEIKVELDRCYDLLHQRQARAAAGLDPDEATVRSERIVEGYEQ